MVATEKSAIYGLFRAWRIAFGSVYRPMGSALSTFAYVSRSRIPASEAAAELARIVEAAVQVNDDAGISGALIFTGEHLAQVIEGPAERIAALRDRLEADDRHEQVVELALPPAATARFAGWSLAYSGASSYVARYLERMHAGPIDPDDVGQLITLMQQFVAGVPRGQAGRPFQPEQRAPTAVRTGPTRPTQPAG